MEDFPRDLCSHGTYENNLANSALPLWIDPGKKQKNIL